MADIGAITQQEMTTYKTTINTRVNIGIQESREIGHQLNDLVLRCTFRGRPCNMTHDFKWIMNAMLFNCYTFDPGEKADNFVTTGPETGLSLLFYLEATNGTQLNAEYDMLLNAANALGVKLMIHRRGIYPIPHIEGMEIMPGHSTSVGFQVTSATRLPPPYGDCIDNATLSGFSSYKYSTTPCLNSCLQRRFINNCGCKSVFQPVPDEYEDDDVYCGTFPDVQDLKE